MPGAALPSLTDNFFKRAENGAAMATKVGEAANDRAPQVQPSRPLVCEFCPPDTPQTQVFQCTVCTKYFCVTHIATFTHDCYVNE